MKPIVVMLTDFGIQDPYVGIMKGVIARINPGIQIIDLTHEIPPGDVQRASIVLWQSLSYFPKGTIFLVVVDPGVGTHLRSIILSPRASYLLGQTMGSLRSSQTKVPIPGSWEIQTSNRFGNAHTSLGVFNPKNHGNFKLLPWIGESVASDIYLENAQLHLQKKGKISWAKTFAEIPEKACAFIVGSSGLLEIAANRINAAHFLGLVPGSTLELSFPGSR